MANPPGSMNKEIKMTSRPSASSSLHTRSFSDTSSPSLSQTPPAKCSPTSSSSAHSPQTTCGSSPAFSLYRPRSDFGGLGGLGLSAVVAAHSQFGTIPEPWRSAEAHSRGSAAFFSPLLAGMPMFTTTFKKQHVAFSQIKDLNGTVNGRPASSPSGKAVVNTSPFAIIGNQEKNKATIKAATKDNHPQKRTAEAASMSSSHSASLSGNSTDGEDSSSDPDDMEEEDNDDSGDEDDPSDASDSDKDTTFKRKFLRLTHNTSDTKKKRPYTSDGYTARDSGTVTAHRSPDDIPLTSSHRLQASTHPAGPPLSTAASMPSEEQHISVIQATGPTAYATPKGQAHNKDFWSSLKSISSTNRWKTSPKHFSHSVSPVKPLSLCSSPESSQLSLPKSPLHSALPKTPALLVPQKPPHKPRQLMSSPKHIHEACNNRNNGKLAAEALFYADSSALRESLSTINASFKTQDWYTSHKNSASQSSLLMTSPQLPSLNRHLLSSANGNSASLFLNHHTDSLIQGDVQDAPLALVTKPYDRSNSPIASRPHFTMAINLSTSNKEPQIKTTATSKCLANGNGKSESEKQKNEDSDDSLEDDDNGGDDTEDSHSSSSESESNLEPNSGSEDDINSDAHRTPLKLAKASFSHKSSSSISANSSLLNMKVLKPPCPPSSLGSATAMTSLEALRNHNNTASFTFVPLPGQRKRVKDEKALRLPLEFGWQRVTRVKTVAGRLQGEVCYYAPCGKKLRQYPDVMKYLVRNGINEISRENFSFSTKIKLGHFYEAREGAEGLQWILLADEEIVPCIIAMDGRRQRKAQCQPAADGLEAKPCPHLQDVTDAKLLRKLEAQEIARQATQIKMMRKLEKQAMAQAAKEAKKQQAMLAAEERRKKKEQMKIIKQQEKIKRIQQIRLEKEVRAQQILEAKRKKKEAAANAKILETEKRNKERELRRLHALLLKHQEKERRKQHVMLIKAVEARKKAEEKERLRKEKKDEKRMNKERKLELRRLELEKAKELKKPREDLCLADHKPLPELSRIPGLVLSGSTFSDCLMVLQFVHLFGKVLGLNINALSLSELQEGLLNVSDGVDKVQDLLVGLVSAAVSDPSLPQGHKSKTSLGEYLTNVEINRDNVSEILRIYMESHCEESDLALSLKTKDFRAHRPSDKASVLAFLVNDLCCIKAVVNEIDKNIDYINNLRKEKWIVEGKLRKLRSIHAKKTGKRDIVVGEDTLPCVNSAARIQSKSKEGDSEEEDDEDEDSDDRDEEEEGEDDEGKKVKKAFEDEEDGTGSVSVEELEKQIEKLYKQQNEIRQKILESSHCLRSMMIGQDRYKRCYWVLPQCGGIFVEGMGTREGHEDVPKEQKQNTAQVMWVKEEQLSEMKEKVVLSPAPSTDEDTAALKCQQDEDSFSYHKPGSLSNLSKLLEEAKMVQDPVNNVHKCHHNPPPASSSYDFCPTSDLGEPQHTSLLGITHKPHIPSLLSHCPASIFHDRNVSMITVEKSHPWFSLLPRLPCDESIVSTGSIPSSSFSQMIKTKSSFSANTAASSGNTTAINNMHLSVQQQVQSGTHQSQETLCDMSSASSSPSLPFPGSSLPPIGELASQHAQSNGNRVSFQASYNSVIKIEAPEPPSDKPTCASSPAVEVAKTQDYSIAQCIPEDMINGWWWISDVKELQILSKTLHCRGIRERFLTKQIQKHMEYMTQFCVHRHVIDVEGLQEQAVSQKMMDWWCVQEQAMKLDISVLKQVETLEKRVISAHLQVKGWMQPKPQSAWGDLVYHEHKSDLSTAQQKLTGTVERRPNNPLDVAVTRLAELEKNIECRNEEEVAPGMKLWHKALSEVRSSAQLSLCIQQLQKSISWDRPVMKVQCQVCHRGDNEDLLLLCDGCDKGCHVYCHKPKITVIPDGDWFCPMCVTETAVGSVIQEGLKSLRTRKQQSLTSGGGKKAREVKRNREPSVAGELIKEEAASSSSSSSMPKKSTTEFKKRKGDNIIASTEVIHDNPVSKRARMAKDGYNYELGMCRLLLDELEAHHDAWPFLKPVNHKSVPGYRKVIKQPMDFSTIREKFTNKQYLHLESFIMDVNLVFDNCEKFNEDNSEIGKAGHSMRRFFDTRWTELLK